MRLLENWLLCPVVKLTEEVMASKPECCRKAIAEAKASQDGRGFCEIHSIAYATYKTSAEWKGVTGTPVVEGK